MVLNFGFCKPIHRFICFSDYEGWVEQQGHISGTRPAQTSVWYGQAALIFLWGPLSLEYSTLNQTEDEFSGKLS